MLKPFRVTVLVATVYRDTFKRNVIVERAKTKRAAMRAVEAKASLFGPCYVIEAEAA